MENKRGCTIPRKSLTLMSSSFHPTHWTLVLRSRGEGEAAKIALSELCEIYYEPVVSFLKREGRVDNEARDLAHSFFQEILKGGIGKPDPNKGKFRSYLLGALKNSLGKKRDAERAVKRGSGAEHVSLTAAEIEGGLSNKESKDDLDFDRDWALALIARALHLLEIENKSKSVQFEILKPWLDGGALTSQATAASELGISESAVKVAIHRLRVRFRELIRKEVAQTVSDPQEVGQELQYLITVVSHQ